MYLTAPSVIRQGNLGHSYDLPVGATLIVL